MATYSWTTGTGGDWNTAANWTPGTGAPSLIPSDPAADVTIDAAPTNGAYTVTIATGESETVNSLIMNGVTNLAGTNIPVYDAALLEIDGTLAFTNTSGGTDSSAGRLSGSLQTTIVMNNGTIVNPGTVDAFIQAEGNDLITGTNGLYVTDWLQALGTVTVDTKSIAEMSGTLLFDGIFEAKGPGATINLGGTLQNLIVNIATMEGPPLIPDGWTELFLNAPTSEINEWNGTKYVGIESTLMEIGSRGTLDVLGGRDYTTTNTLSIDAGAMLNLVAGTVTTGGLDINRGIVQGSATIAGGVVNDGTLEAVGGALQVLGGLTGTGTVGFDVDGKTGTLDSAGATLELDGVSAGQTIVMNGDDTLRLDTPAAFAGSISAKLGDTIVLQGISATSAVLQGGTLVLSDGTQTVGSIALSGSYAGVGFGTTLAGGNTTVIVTTQTAPTINGLAAGETGIDTVSQTPFAAVAVSDPDVGAATSASIRLTSGGVATDADGLLSGAGLRKTGIGTYSLATTSPATLSAELQALMFTPTARQVAPGSTVATSFGLTIAEGSATTSASTTLTVTAQTAAPTITGLPAREAGTDTAALAPFAAIAIGDPDLGAATSASITLTSSGVATDADGLLSGAGLSKTGNGTYSLAATSPASLSTELQGLVFAPTAHQVAPGSSAATSFGLTVAEGSATTTASTTLTITAAAPPPPPPSANFMVADTTTHNSTSAAGDTYTGPVAGLQHQYINITTDSLNITATVANSFIHTGSGTDAIDVSKVGGTNVLDGSTGSNFLVGGSGNDTFFVDDRIATADIWSTIANFHVGDATTVYGVTAADFNLDWEDNQGAAGYTGLTLHATAANKPIASMTLVGYTKADLTDGRLTVSFGNDPASHSNYMYVHGN
ncbi:beta strand repeat-containing protein [Rhodopila sp.]|uniref:beta strand repeat-containing protein n=1 Tax=Rhodopila sp. TaxID=2480087 RepID=UPI003D0ADDA3